jgi:hypothetical protein
MLPPREIEVCYHNLNGRALILVVHIDMLPVVYKSRSNNRWYELYIHKKQQIFRTHRISLHHSTVSNTTDDKLQLAER